MFTQQEKEVLIKMISEVRIMPLAPDAIPLITVLQSAAKKIAESHEGRADGGLHSDRD